MQMSLPQPEHLPAAASAWTGCWSLQPDTLLHLCHSEGPGMAEIDMDDTDTPTNGQW